MLDIHSFNCLYVLKLKIHCSYNCLCLDNLVAGVEMKIWFNITENSLDKLYNDPRYPDNPDNVTILSSFDTGQNKGDYYGCKLSALYQVRHF
jgi:hypothetical protein